MDPQRRSLDPVRPELDREAKRYFVYRLCAADGTVLYVGRSCQPLARLREHHRSTSWARDVVQIETWGPLTWGEACEAERDRIYADKPSHNRMFILTHTHREPTLA